ncbi:MAG TPA: EVE domain-containing protein [Oceanipulchritudo sp.]|nr:EVE domain-containing protein [Oceanipulchritudo sp.]
MKNIWLMKSEPEVFSFDDLKQKKTTMWDGVRNYQARNFMRDDMRKGDLVLFYHSNCAEPGIVGLAEIASQTAYPDPTQFDPKSEYHDPKSTPENPRWLVVDVRYKRALKRPATLAAIKAHPALKDMKVAQRGMRLSIQPVDPEHYAVLEREFWS